MSWNVDLLKSLRYMVGDVSSTQTYSDDRLKQTILVAAKFVKHDLPFSVDYQISLGTSGTLSPDPTLNYDVDFSTLTVLRAAALIEGQVARQLADSAGTTVTLGPMTINTGAATLSVQNLLSNGFTSAYDRAALEYGMVGNGALLSYEAIINPASIPGSISSETSTLQNSFLPTLEFIDLGNGADMLASITGSNGDASNLVQISGSWIDIGTRTGDGTISFASGIGNHNGRLISTSAFATFTSETQAFQILPREPNLAIQTSGNAINGSGSVSNTSFGTFNIFQYAPSGGSSYVNYASGLNNFTFSFSLPSGSYTSRIYSEKNGVSITSDSTEFLNSLYYPDLSLTSLGNGVTVSGVVTGSFNQAFNVIQTKPVGSSTWVDTASGTSNFAQNFTIGSPGTYNGRVHSMYNGAEIYTAEITFTLSNPITTPSLVVVNQYDGSSVSGTVTASYSGAFNIIQTRLINTSDWINSASGTGNITRGFNMASGAGTYQGRVQSSYLSATLFSPTVQFQVSNSGSSAPALSLPEIPTSDSNMRATVNAAHYSWDLTTYSYYDDVANDAQVILGTRLNYALTTEDAITGSYLDPFEGLASTSEILAGKVHASDRYNSLRTAFKASHPDKLIGTYVGGYALKESGWMYSTGKNYPPDSDLVDPYLPDCTGVANPNEAPGSVAGIKLTESQCVNHMSDRLLKMACGKLRNSIQEDVLWIDEIGYTVNTWDTQRTRLTALKTAFHASGVRLAMNFGGTAFDQTQFFGPDLFGGVVEMCDLVTLESPWHKGNGSDGHCLRSEDNTRRIISNYRGVMDSGVAITLLPGTFDYEMNHFGIVSATEVSAGTRMLVTTNGPHHLFPASKYNADNIVLRNLPTAFSALEAYVWTAEEVVGQANQVRLYSRFLTLSQIKNIEGLGTISFSQGTLDDVYASTRLVAGLVMMTRRVGDKMFVTTSPNITQYLAGSGDQNNRDCWWYWPQQLGDPTGDFVIDSNYGDMVSQMHRDFQNGTVYVYPSGGYVDITYL